MTLGTIFWQCLRNIFGKEGVFQLIIREMLTFNQLLGYQTWNEFELLALLSQHANCQIFFVQWETDPPRVDIFNFISISAEFKYFVGRRNPPSRIPSSISTATAAPYIYVIQQYFPAWKIRIINPIWITNTSSSTSFFTINVPPPSPRHKNNRSWACYTNGSVQCSVPLMWHDSTHLTSQHELHRGYEYLHQLLVPWQSMQ